MQGISISRTNTILSDALSTASSHYTERVTDTASEFGQRICQYLSGSDIRSTESMEEVQSKTTRRVLSLKERIDVIKMAENLRDTRELARHFHCGRTQILSILQQRERLLKEWANNGDPNRLRRRPSTFAVAINKLVAEWIQRARSVQLSLPDRIIMEKAYQAKKFLKYSEFRPNKRWLGRFKGRFKLDDIDLVTPDPSLSNGIEKSLKLSDIFEDIKETLDPSIVDVMIERQASVEHRLFLLAENENPEISPAVSVRDWPSSSNNDISEADDVEVVRYVEIVDGDDDDESSWQFDSMCETQIVVEEDPPTDPITDDTEALECLKRLEEYSMLKENFRAIGLIIQLEKIYKGQLEA